METLERNVESARSGTLKTTKPSARKTSNSLLTASLRFAMFRNECRRDLSIQRISEAPSPRGKFIVARDNSFAAEMPMLDQMPKRHRNIAGMTIRLWSRSRHQRRKQTIIANCRCRSTMLTCPRHRATATRATRHDGGYQRVERSSRKTRLQRLSSVSRIDANDFRLGFLDEEGLSRRPGDERWLITHECRVGEIPACVQRRRSVSTLKRSPRRRGIDAVR